MRDGATLQLPPPHHEKRLEGRYIQNLRRLPPPQQQLQSTPQGGCMRLTIVANNFLWLLLLLAAAPAYCEPPNSGHRWGSGPSGSSGTSGPAWYTNSDWNQLLCPGAPLQIEVKGHLNANIMA